MSEAPSGLRALLAELKRRKVYHVAAAYVAASIVVATATAELFDDLLLPDWTPRLVILLLVIGFPIALVLAWAYEIKPEELRPVEPAAEKGRRRSDTPAPTEVAAVEQRKSIIVLPFDNLSPDPADAYFSDGLTEEIITNLSHIHSLRVISRNSAMVLKGTQKSTRAIAEELDLQYVLEGSVRKAGDDLRITAQLIDARSDAHLWAERYDGSLGDVFGIQEEVARSIVAALNLKLSPAEERQVAARPIADPHAYDTWVLAKYEAGKSSKEGLDRAIQLANEALSVVGDNPLLYATLGKIYYWAYEFGLSQYEETLLQVERYAAKALELDPDLAEARHALALARFKQGDFEGCFRYMKRAVSSARDSDALGFLAVLLAEVGRVSEARGYADEAMATDPLTFLPSLYRSLVDIFDGQLAAALDRLRDARKRLAPGEAFAGWWLAQAAAYAGAEDEARAVFAEVAGIKADFWSDMCALFRSAIDGNEREVHDLLDNTNLREVAKSDEYYPIFLANALARVGDTDEALHWVDQAISWGFANDRFLSEHNRHLEPLRGDPRFQVLVGRAREKAAAFDA